MTVENSELQGYDEAQKEMMDENCIVVDENDRIVGRDSKINCHLNEGKLHRAFSVLIFDSTNKLLIQQRADEKITFPSIWANSCCSHPLYQNGEEEDIKGAKKAAVRKLAQELGILSGEIQFEDLNFITKMHYKARADQKWIEHEVDYIFALKKDVKIDPNPNEIQRTKYVDVKELNELFEKSNDNDIKIGPWFRLIRDNFLNEIWKNIDSLDAISDNKVHHMGEVK
ncbi:MAG: isopentenyl-diphosphate delta-isomerase [Candidatus Poseidoniales archaeon]|nr:MAG: isopentenyl-diphosphate delta-isomerase [bacterium TMED264]|tara:strand:- start:917 stop:1597 length:681 start_codon:yes stop_codon:yes gene_type:complete